MAKKLLFLVLLVRLCLSAVFSSDVYLTEAEYRELLNIIKTSEGNSKAQERLIAGLRKTLREQEAELRQALNTQEMLQAELKQALDTLNRSDADLTALRDTLSRIRSYSDGLTEYCSALENEKGRLKTENRMLQIGAGCIGRCGGVIGNHTFAVIVIRVINVVIRNRIRVCFIMDILEVFVEIAKFVLTAVGTFLSVFSLSFAVFQYWRKKQDEKFDLFKKSVDDKIRAEAESLKESDVRHESRLRELETTMAQRFESRLSSMEGELKGIKSILQSIQNWFVNNTTGGK